MGRTGTADTNTSVVQATIFLLDNNVESLYYYCSFITTILLLLLLFVLTPPNLLEIVQ